MRRVPPATSPRIPSRTRGLRWATRWADSSSLATLPMGRRVSGRVALCRRAQWQPAARALVHPSASRETRCSTRASCFQGPTRAASWRAPAVRRLRFCCVRACTTSRVVDCSSRAARRGSSRSRPQAACQTRSLGSTTQRHARTRRSVLSGSRTARRRSWAIRIRRPAVS